MNDKIIRSKRRKIKIRSRFSKEGHRLVVNRSNKYFYAYLLDQKTGKTVFGGSEKKLLVEKDAKQTKTEKAKVFGIAFAKEAVKMNFKKVVFDRSGFLYHGRVKAFVEGAREGGLEF